MTITLAAALAAITTNVRKGFGVLAAIGRKARTPTLVPLPRPATFKKGS